MQSSMNDYGIHIVWTYICWEYNCGHRNTESELHHRYHLVIKCPPECAHLTCSCWGTREWQAPLSDVLPSRPVPAVVWGHHWPVAELWFAPPERNHSTTCVSTGNAQRITRIEASRQEWCMRFSARIVCGRNQEDKRRSGWVNTGKQCDEELGMST